MKNDTRFVGPARGQPDQLGQRDVAQTKGSKLLQVQSLSAGNFGATYCTRNVSGGKWFRSYDMFAARVSAGIVEDITTFAVLARITINHVKGGTMTYWLSLAARKSVSNVVVAKRTNLSGRLMIKLHLRLRRHLRPAHENSI